MSQFTKKAIIDSFMKLLEQKPLDKITVKDIVMDCGVNRGTFYYYYEDIFALVDDIFEIETNRVLEQAGGSVDSWKEGFILSTKFALKNKKIIFHAYNSLNREQLVNYLYKTTYKFIDEYINIQSQDLNVFESDKAFIAKFYQSALVSLSLEWIGGGMKDDPLIQIEQLGKLFDGSVREALEKSNPKAGK